MSLRDAVEIVPYDPAWPALFAAEAARIRAVLDDRLCRCIEHFGSTAIAGLAAKPIIDILILTETLPTPERLVEPLRSLDYVFWGANPKTDRHFFVKGMPPFGTGRTHHVHVAALGGEMHTRLFFRDYLRTHSETARAYENLKRELAARHADDREAYTDAKRGFIEAVMAKKPV